MLDFSAALAASAMGLFDFELGVRCGALKCDLRRLVQGFVGGAGEGAGYWGLGGVGGAEIEL